MALKMSVKDPEAEEVSEKESTQRLVDKVKERAAAKSAEPREPVEVDLEDDDDEPDGPSRDEKKQNRWREHKERASAAERERDEAKERAANIERQFAVQQQNFALLQNQLGKKDQKDPHDEEIEKVDRERRDLLNTYTARANTMTAAELEEMRSRAESLETRKYEAVAKRAMAKNQPQGPNVQAEVLRGQMAAKYPDIWGSNNQSAQQVMQGIYMAKVRSGKPEGFETGDEAAEETRRALGMRTSAPKPPPGTRERYSGIPAGQSGAKGPRSITMDRDQQRLAEKMYPRDAKGNKLTPAQSHKVWAQKVGARAQKTAT